MSGDHNINQTEQDTVQRLSALVRAQQITIDKLEAQQEQEPRNIRERWNIEFDGDDLLVCFNKHEKSEGCRHERYVPATTTPPQREWVGLDWLPEHKCGLYLSHNEHRDVYETIEEFYDAKDFISQEEWHKAVKEDSVWVLQWYPNTPIGFNRIAASTLQAIKTKLKELNT